jgi:hypothetical protein
MRGICNQHFGMVDAPDDCVSCREVDMEAAELRRLLVKAAAQVSRVMQTWHDDEWDALDRLGIQLGESEAE